VHWSNLFIDLTDSNLLLTAESNCRTLSKFQSFQKTIAYLYGQLLKASIILLSA